MWFAIYYIHRIIIHFSQKIYIRDGRPAGRNEDKADAHSALLTVRGMNGAVGEPNVRSPRSHCRPVRIRTSICVKMETCKCATVLRVFYWALKHVFSSVHIVDVVFVDDSQMVVVGLDELVDEKKAYASKYRGNRAVIAMVVCIWAVWVSFWCVLWLRVRSLPLSDTRWLMVLAYGCC